MASIKKSANGKRWRAFVDKCGYKKTATFDTKGEAVAWAHLEERRAVEHVKIINNYRSNRSSSALLNPDKIVSSSVALPNSIGIYFLIENGVIVYVGKSENMLNRIAGHSEKGRPFDRYFAIPCAKEILDELERAYISALRPRGEQNLINGTKLGLFYITI